MARLRWAANYDLLIGDLQDANTLEAPDAVQPAAGTAAVIDGRLHVPVPAAGFAAVRVRMTG